MNRCGESRVRAVICIHAHDSPDSRQGNRHLLETRPSHPGQPVRTAWERRPGGAPTPGRCPSNAVAVGSGEATLKQMVRAGVWLSIVALVLIMVVLYTLVRMVFDVSI